MVQSVIPTLNSLIEVCDSGVQGYQTAASSIEHPHYRRLFRQISLQRAKFSATLKILVTRYGGQPIPLAEARASGESAWQTVSRDQFYAVLNACERDESQAVTRYQRALEDELPSGIRPILQRQFIVVCSTHERIRALRDIVH